MDAMTPPSLVWFRDDLRLADNPALRAAADRDEPVIGVYVLDEASPGVRPLGGAARWWLHHSLSELDERLREKGSVLVLRRGAASDVLPALVGETGAGAVFWNRRYGGPEREIDAGIKDGLRGDGVEVTSFAGSLLYEPWTVRTGAGTPYGVFTPFWNACRQLPAPRAPIPEPRELRGPRRHPASDGLAEWELLPTSPDWASGLRERWEPGERAAKARLREFLADDAADYDRARDEPAAGATSLLSPRLRWGELSPHEVWHAAVSSDAQVGGFLSELGWREFAWHTLFHRGALESRGLDRRYDAFPWRSEGESAAETAAWRKGETGFGLVDAGMRELWQTGVMHNRVRMVVASFLTKNLLVDWRVGEAWFWDTLVDADRASNPFNWQWVAGCGVDAAPYFRVFNPVTQQKKFDPDGKYVDRWAPDSLLTPPIVDLAETRQRALDAYEQIRGLPRA